LKEDSFKVARMTRRDKDAVHGVPKHTTTIGYNTNILYKNEIHNA